MKTKTKRLQALFLALAMSVGVLQASAFAATDVIIDPIPKTHQGHELDYGYPNIKSDGKYTIAVECLDCDETFVLNGVAETVATTNATCTLPATVTYQVTVPGFSHPVQSVFSTADALGHDYDYKFVWPKLNYLSKGYNSVDVQVQEVCKRCNAKGEVDEPADVQEDASKRVNPVAPCKAGSVTLTAYYVYNKHIVAQESKEYPYTLSKDGIQAHKPGQYVIENEVEATCTKGGSWDRVQHCTACGDVLHSVPYKTGKTGHTAGTAKKENVVAATPAKAGSYDLVIRCTDCGKVLSKTHKTTAKIVVNASKVTKATNVKGKKAKITVKKAASVTGYQIQYGTKKNFKGAKAVKTKATTKTLTKLTKNKKYYVRVRTYKVISGKTYYSSWSGSKTVTIKK